MRNIQMNHRCKTHNRIYNESRYVKFLQTMMSKILFAIIFCSLTTVGIAYAETETQYEPSTVEIEQQQYIIKKTGSTIVKIFGTIDPTSIYASIILERTSPDGESNTQSGKATKEGYYEFYFFHDWESLRGNYDMTISLDAVEFGNVSYEIIEDPTYKTDEEIKEEYYLKQSGNFEEETINPTESELIIPKKIPDWVKNVFGWYYMDRISEEEVISAIEFLVRSEIIKLD